MAIIPGIYASQISGHLITSNFFIISQQNVSAVSTVTFSSIPATYKSLQLRFNLVWSVANANGTPKIQFNGDTGGNYGYHVLEGDGSGAGSGGAVSQTSILPMGAQGITYPLVGIVDVIDYANANKNKVTKSLTGFNNNTATGVIDVRSGVWFSTAAITSLTVLGTVGTFTGTISLYGVS